MRPSFNPLVALSAALLIALPAAGCGDLSEEGREGEPEISVPEPPLPAGLSRDNPLFVGKPTGDGEVERVTAALSDERATDSHGGGEGGSFTFRPGSRWRLAHVRLRCGKYMDSLEAWWEDENGILRYSGQAGGGGGTDTLDVAIPANDKITGAVVNAGKYVDRISLKFRSGRTETCVGWDLGGFPFRRPRGRKEDNTGGAPFPIEAGTGRTIEGFTGESGKYLDAIGFLTFAR